MHRPQIYSIWHSYFLPLINFIERSAVHLWKAVSNTMKKLISKQPRRFHTESIHCLSKRWNQCIDISGNYASVVMLFINLINIYFRYNRILFFRFGLLLYFRFFSDVMSTVKEKNLKLFIVNFIIQFCRKIHSI